MGKKQEKNMNERQRAVENAIRRIAEREGVTVESVRKHMQIAMLNGLCSTDPKVRAFWDSIPHKEDVPTPEEFIIFVSRTIKCRNSREVF